MTNGKVETKKEHIESLIGEKDVRVITPTSLHAMEMGVIIEIHIGRWRARTRLELGDLGLSKTVDYDVYGYLIRLGDKKLLPTTEINGKQTSYVDILDSIESHARRCLEINSFKTHWGRFVPHTMYSRWKEENEKIRTEYLKIRDEICERYNIIVNNLITSYQSMARDSYNRTDKSCPEDTYIDNFLNSVRNLIPTKERIYDSFYFIADIGFVPLPSDYEKDVARAEKVRHMAELASEADRAKIQGIRQMQLDAISQLRTKKVEMVDVFMNDLQKQIRSQIYDAVVDVLESINRNDGKLIGKSASQLSNLINYIDSMNFYGDTDIDSMIKTIKGKLGDSNKERSVDEIKTNLEQIGTLTRATLLSLGESPRMGRGVGIEYQPDETLLRATRRALGINEDNEVEIATRAIQRPLALESDVQTNTKEA